MLAPSGGRQQNGSIAPPLLCLHRIPSPCCCQVKIQVAGWVLTISAPVEQMFMTLEVGVSNQLRFLMTEQSLEHAGASFTLFLSSSAVVKLKYKDCLLASNKRAQKQRDFQCPGEMRQKLRSPRNRFILPAERPESGSLVFISPRSFSIPWSSPHRGKEKIVAVLEYIG